MDIPFAFAVPGSTMETVLKSLNTTAVEGAEMYWHIHILGGAGYKFFLQLPKKGDTLGLDGYKVQLDELEPQALPSCAALLSGKPD